MKVFVQVATSCARLVIVVTAGYQLVMTELLTEVSEDTQV